ncbi:MAG: cation:proton antiporter [Chloroflexi bacterium]|nr:cation:proton antiporter [Chloroflexota bacterium]
MEEPLKLVADLVVRLAIILFAAKIGAEIAGRFLRIPPVLGELGAGIAIGPFALGGLSIGGIGPVFEVPHDSTVPIANELFFIAQAAAVILLFQAGLETNRRQFFKYVGPATAVAMGGVILPLSLGVAATLLFGFGSTASIRDLGPALFVGAAMTATSVGITARVLADIRRLDTPEGVTILGAAVVDDVLGILVLAVVIGIEETGAISAASIGIIAAKAVGFWLGLTAVGILASRPLSAAIGKFRSTGASLALGLAVAFAAAGLAESFGLAMIIGAYSIGLALSETDLRHRIEEPMLIVSQFLVPVFFVVIGMQVDVPAILRGALVFGAVLSVLAIASKIVGAGAPAYAVGFNTRGTLRIAIGMVPRGEVALIIAGIGLASGAINSEIFGVVILMTVATTIVAPLLLVPAFKDGTSGLRKSPATGQAAETGPATTTPAPAVPPAGSPGGPGDRPSRP